MSNRGSSYRKITGLSKASIRHRYHGLNRHSAVLPAGRQGERVEAAQSKRRQEISGECPFFFVTYGAADHRLLLEMSSVDRETVENMISDIGMVIDDEPYTAPPGEEGLDISHEGGEYEAFEGLSEQVASLSN